MQKPTEYDYSGYIYHITLSRIINIKMKGQNYFLFLVLFTILQRCIFLSSGLQEHSKLYVVYLGEKHHEDPNVVMALHLEILANVHESKEDALKSMTYSYRHGFSGFAAVLTESQAKIITELPEVKSVTPNCLIHGHTTRSWDFLGVSYKNEPDELLTKANYGDGIIIGVIDSGVWPESKSFDDTEYGPIPKRWKGECQVGVKFNERHCNRKIIGARFYSSAANEDDLKTDDLSPRDNNGHGTHTASTAAGSFVANASFNGLAAGTARGGAPKARLAIYKALWGSTGRGGLADILKAVDDAIHDGVDIISMSLGSSKGYILPYAMLHAVAKGISVVSAAGNDGPAPQTVINDSPWILTVAASTLDRSYPTIITLGNKEKLLAQSIFYGPKEKKFTELLVISERCDGVGLNRTDIIGKVIVCSPSSLSTSNPLIDIPTAVFYAKQAGVKGLIHTHYSSFINLDSTISGDIPLLIIEFELLDQINRYVNSVDSTPTVRIEPTRSVTGSKVLAPRVAAFSSRGPSPYSALLKPDITAPGVSILAAKQTSYAFSSGTSMSCPAVSGVVALLKSLHPNWSPAAIKSALMTTASQSDIYGVPIEAESVPRKLADPFDFGAGHIDPTRATSPGLIYDIDPKDYFKFFGCDHSGSLALCVGEDDQHLYNLNLPSIAIPSLKTSTTVYRTVTNVGKVKASYKAVIESPGGVETFVEPSILSFDEGVRVLTFKVVFANKHQVQADFNFGSLTWVEVGGGHRVRVPLAVRRVILDNFADL